MRFLDLIVFDKCTRCIDAGLQFRFELPLIVPVIHFHVLEICEAASADQQQIFLQVFLQPAQLYFVDIIFGNQSECYTVPCIKQVKSRITIKFDFLRTVFWCLSRILLYFRFNSRFWYADFQDLEWIAELDELSGVKLC